MIIPCPIYTGPHTSDRFEIIVISVNSSPVGRSPLQVLIACSSHEKRTSVFDPPACLKTSFKCFKLP